MCILRDATKHAFFYGHYFYCLISVQHECIPQAVLGMDILCQAKSGMGKTAVFVLATLQQLEPTENQVYVLVMCHTRELAFQISKEYERFSKYMPQTKVCLLVLYLLMKMPCHLINVRIESHLCVRDLQICRGIENWAFDQKIEG